MKHRIFRYTRTVNSYSKYGIEYRWHYSYIFVISIFLFDRFSKDFIFNWCGKERFNKVPSLKDIPAKSIKDILVF